MISISLLKGLFELSVKFCSELSFHKKLSWILCQEICRSPFQWDWQLQNYCVNFGHVIFSCFSLRQGWGFVVAFWHCPWIWHCVVLQTTAADPSHCGLALGEKGLHQSGGRESSSLSGDAYGCTHSTHPVLFGTKSENLMPDLNPAKLHRCWKVPLSNLGCSEVFQAPPTSLESSHLCFPAQSAEAVLSARG